MQEHKRILVVAAHPDDEVLGCGGTIARLVAQGYEVSVAILGEGSTSRALRRDQGADSSVDELEAQAKSVSALLGVSDLRCCRLPDNRFDTLPLLEVAKVVEEVLSDRKPETVFTHSGGDLNRDHQVAFQATLIATRPQGANTVREVYSYEVLSSSEWSFQRLEPVFRPNIYVDITQTLDKKIAALKLYAGEVRDFPHPRSPEALRAAAMRWGSVSGMLAAEAFEAVRICR